MAKSRNEQISLAAAFCSRCSSCPCFTFKGKVTMILHEGLGFIMIWLFSVFVFVIHEQLLLLKSIVHRFISINSDIRSVQK